MSPTYKPAPAAPFLKGCVASSDPYTQVKGSFPRGSNMLLNKRGALDVCDGSQLIHAFNGAVQSGRGKIMCTFLFSPTGVSRYYLAIAKALDLPLGPPQNLTVATAGGGNLAAATYFYKVTALDGAGGETTASNEVNVVTGVSGKNTLTWNTVPNATGYKVYRGTSSNSEVLLNSPSLPATQVAPGTLTASFVDDGTGTVASIAVTRADGNSFGNQAIYQTAVPHNLTPGQVFNVTGNTDAVFNVTAAIANGILSPTQFIIVAPFGTFPYLNHHGTGGVLTTGAPPSQDNTQQTALFKMPMILGSPASLPVSYNNINIVALFPADAGGVGLPNVDGGGGGGSGGGGGTGGGGSTGGGTVSGGIPGNVSFIPQMVEFTNRVAIALGNGFPPQEFSDPSTLVNPATTAAISTVAVDAFGVVTVTTSVPHGLSANQVGANVLLKNISNGLYNGAFPTLQIVSPTVFLVRNLAAIGQAGSTGGTSTTTAIPITSSFTPAFPTWSATTAYSTNSVVAPTVANGHYYIAIQGGTSGSVQPTFPTNTGGQVADGGIIWREAGLVNTAAPAPPGCAHLAVYAGSLWVINTSPTNTPTGIDGPCSVRMSDVNNLRSWNPINQAFLDKDDGTEGMGLASETITAQGIPPQGSLIAFKNYTTYQMIGIFGSPTFAIQRIKSDMGCLAPRSIQFVPGFGLKRFTHLGFAIFDGVEDRVTSEDIRPFLFPTGDFQENDITVLDAQWQNVIWAFQTANPPMYCAAIPIGNSGGQLTRILCYDLVLKAWAAPIDLPFPISTAAQFRTSIANPVTILGGFSDGLLSRWQAGDQLWDVGATGVRAPSQISWSVKCPEVFAQNVEQKLNCRRVAVKGIATAAVSPITVTPIVDGKSKPSQPYQIPASGDFTLFASFMRDGTRFSAVISGQGKLQLSRPTFHVTQKEVGAAAVIS